MTTAAEIISTGIKGPDAVGNADEVTLRFPRSTVANLTAIADTLNDRMHRLLERNTEGELSAIEREELETLVDMTQFAQVLELSVRLGSRP